MTYGIVCDNIRTVSRAASKPLIRIAYRLVCRTKEKENENMKVKSKQEAWRKADEIFSTDYTKDDIRSNRAGYDIYRSTAAGVNAWISDLGDRLEVNMENGKTVNIWIDEEQFPEYQLKDALRVISDAIYEIDDNILPDLQKATGLDEARAKIYGAYAEIAKILKAQHPDSKLYDMYNLKDA